MRELCKECIYAKDCKIPCPAFYELHRIYDEQDAKDKTVLIRNLKK